MFFQRPFIKRLRNKWREIPLGWGERIFSADLLRLDDARFLEIWNAHNEARRPFWYREQYAEQVAGKNLLDLGCGFSTDGIYFIQRGARVTFADIVPDNLKATERAVKLLGLSANFYFIEDVERFAFEEPFDYIFALGSLHHAPFEMVKKEVSALEPFLKPGGHFLFFSYPLERFKETGARDFAEFGRMTDGKRTPWAEWYDDEKIKSLFAPAFTIIFSRNFGRQETDFNWFDLRKLPAP